MSLDNTDKCKLFPRSPILHILMSVNDNDSN